MAENKASRWRRLLAEGGEERWNAYQDRWKAIKKRFGCTKEEAQAMADEEFPPLKQGEPSIPVLTPLPAPEDDEIPKDEPPKPEPPPKRPPGRPRKERPPEPEKSVEKPATVPKPRPNVRLTLEEFDAYQDGGSSSPIDDAMWVNAALPFYLSFIEQERESDMAAMIHRAPSPGAISLLQRAADNPQKFATEVYYKMVAKYKLNEDEARRDDNRHVFTLLDQFEEDQKRAS